MTPERLYLLADGLLLGKLPATDAYWYPLGARKRQIWSKKEENGLRKDIPWGQKETTWILWPSACCLPRRECEREVKKMCRKYLQEGSRGCSQRLRHVISNSRDNLHPQNNPVALLQFSVVFFFLKSGLITVITSMRSRCNERGYFFLCAIKY